MKSGTLLFAFALSKRSYVEKSMYWSKSSLSVSKDCKVVKSMDIPCFSFLHNILMVIMGTYMLVRNDIGYGDIFVAPAQKIFLRHSEV